jgi:hypothetical protein
LAFSAILSLLVFEILFLALSLLSLLSRAKLPSFKQPSPTKPILFPANSSLILMPGLPMMNCWLIPPVRKTMSAWPFKFARNGAGAAMLPN